MYDISNPIESSDKLGFCLCDTMGLEDTQNVDTLGFPYLLDGHIEDRYQVSILTVHILYEIIASIIEQNLIFIRER